MPKNNSLKSVLIIGSGPIVIGQACEFDYSGSQAARSLREEGIEVSLINSNPATIMTDKVVADHIYLKPLTTASIIEILEERDLLKDYPSKLKALDKKLFDEFTIISSKVIFDKSVSLMKLLRFVI